MTKPILLLLSILSYASVSQAQSNLANHRIPHQVFGGVVGSAVGMATGVGFGFMATNVFSERNRGWVAISYVSAGAILGLAIGNGVGVYMFGNTATEKGNLEITLSGSIAGLIVGTAIGSQQGDAILPIIATSVTIGSMIGYNTTRTATVSFLRAATPAFSHPPTTHTPFTIPEPQVALIRIRL